MIAKILNHQQLKAICDVLADTNRGLTKTEISRLLQQCQIQLVEDGASSNQYTYTFGLNKKIGYTIALRIKSILKNHLIEFFYLFKKHLIR